MTGVTNVDPCDTENFSIIAQPTANHMGVDTSSNLDSVDLLLNTARDASPHRLSVSTPAVAVVTSSSKPFVEWVPATVCTINPNNKSFYIRCCKPAPSHRGFGDTDVREELVPAVAVWRLEEALSAGAVALSAGWQRIWNNEHCAVYLPTPPPGFIALGLVTVKMNPKERWTVPFPENPVLCINELSEQLQKVSPFTIAKHVWHSRKTEPTPFKLHRLRHGLVWPEPSRFSNVSVPEARVLNRVVLPDTRQLVDRILALKSGQVAAREDEKEPLNPALVGIPVPLEGTSATQLEGIHEAIRRERPAVAITDDLEKLISFALLQVHGAQVIIDYTTERAEAAAAAIGAERFSAALEAKTALKPPMLAAAGVIIPVDEHLCTLIQDALERRVAPYAAAAKEDPETDMRFSATAAELQGFVDSVLATSIVAQVRSTVHWRSTRVLRHADLKAAGLPDDLPPSLIDVVQAAVATTPDPPQTLRDLRKLAFSALRVSCTVLFDHFYFVCSNSGVNAGVR